MIKIIQNIRRVKFELKGEDYSGEYSSTHKFQYILENSKTDNITGFRVLYLVKIQWDNGSTAYFDAYAVNEFPRFNGKPSLDFLVNLAKDSLIKLVDKFTGHANFKKIQIKEKFISFTTADVRKIQRLINGYDLYNSS